MGHCRIVARRWQPRAAALLALVLGAAVPAHAFDALAGADYEAGRGLSLPALDLTLRGYTTVLYEDQEGDAARGEWHDLSLMLIWQPRPAWQVFTELEAEEVLTADHRGLTGGDAEVQVERLYVDYSARPSANLRFGQFLTPFGRWNEIHADPLVWTVTRPLATVIAVPDHVVGGMVFGTVPLARDSVEYKAWFDASDELDPSSDHTSFEDYSLPGLYNDFAHALGAQLRYHFADGRAQLGVSYAAFETYRGRGHHQALGVDGLYSWRRVELSGELLYRANLDQHGSDDWGGFVQLVVPLVDRVYGVARGEYYRSGPLDTHARRASAGLAWRPRQDLNFKFEYHDGSERGLLPDGIELSFSVLF